MTIFEALPTVNYCCCCISLKFGSVLIALLGILNGGNIAGLILSPMCPDDSETVPELAKYIQYAYGVCVLLVFIASIVFLIGIFTDNAFTATIYLYVAVLYILSTLLFFAYTVFSILTYDECQLNFSLVPIVLAFLLTFYFMIVVRSFRDDMAD